MYLYLDRIRGLPRATAKVLAVVITVIIARHKTPLSHMVQTRGLGPINVAGSLQSLLSIIGSGTLHAVGSVMR